MSDDKKKNDKASILHDSKKQVIVLTLDTDDAVWLLHSGIRACNLPAQGSISTVRRRNLLMDLKQKWMSGQAEGQSL